MTSFLPNCTTVGTILNPSIGSGACREAWQPIESSREFSVAVRLSPVTVQTCALSLSSPTSGEPFEMTEQSPTPDPHAIPRNFNQQCLRRHLNERAWHRCLHDVHLTPYTTTPLKTSLAFLADRALKSGSARGNVIVQVTDFNVSDLRYEGFSAGAYVLDRTGKIAAAISPDVFSRHNTEITDGTILQLINIVVVFYPLRRADAYHIDVSNGFHVSVLPKNVKAVWCARPSLNFTLLPLEIKYHNEANNPLVLDHQMLKTCRTGCRYDCECYTRRSSALRNLPNASSTTRKDQALTVREEVAEPARKKPKTSRLSRKKRSAAHNE